jgi:hypothetical protein
MGFFEVFVRLTSDIICLCRRGRVRPSPRAYTVVITKIVNNHPNS